MGRFEGYQQQLDELDLVTGRDFAERTPHNYSHRAILRLADASLQDTIAFEPVVAELASVIELRPKVESIVA